MDKRVKKIILQREFDEIFTKFIIKKVRSLISQLGDLQMLKQKSTTIWAVLIAWYALELALIVYVNCTAIQKELPTAAIIVLAALDLLFLVMLFLRMRWTIRFIKNLRKKRVVDRFGEFGDYSESAVDEQMNADSTNVVRFTLLEGVLVVVLLSILQNII